MRSDLTPSQLFAISFQFDRQNLGVFRIGSDGTRVGQNRGCDRMLRCGAPFFCAGPVRYVNTCVHAKFEANLCTWAPSRTVDVSRFRVGRRAATAGGDRVAAARRPPPRGGHRLPNSCAPPNSCTSASCRPLLLGYLGVDLNTKN